MESVEFNPLGKMLLFHWDEYTCHRCKYGYCPLDSFTLDELKRLDAPKQTPDEFSWAYCVRLAVHYFKYVDRLKTTFCNGISITYYEKCGHYSFADGRHRTCVIGHLLQKGSQTKMYAYLQVNDEWECAWCLTHGSYKSHNKKLTWLDKIFKTKKYRLLTHQFNKDDEFYFFENKIDD